MDLREQLAEQFQSLETTSHAYDAGDRDAALRLATPLRTMFHQGGGSISLLAHLGARYIDLRSTAAERPKNDPSAYWPSLISWALNPQESIFECAPKFDTAKKSHRFVPFSFWWESESIYQFEHVKIRRRDLVLHAANQVGESPVEETFPPRHRPLLDGVGWLATIRPTGAFEREILLYHGHLASLRQIAHEVLNTPDLRKLSERESC